MSDKLQSTKASGFRKLVPMAVLLFASCADADPVVGGLYSIVGDEEGYVVVKVIAVDDAAVHLRIYREQFSTRPNDIDSSALSLGSIDDPNGLGIGHIPLARRDFKYSWPVLITQETVSEEELEGYRIWEESGGGVFTQE